jgi:hypothetical protein
MRDRTTELGTEMRQLVTPLRGEAVVVQSFVFRPDFIALLVVGGKTEAAVLRSDSPATDSSRSSAPSVRRHSSFAASAPYVSLPSSAAAQREPSVPATRTLCDPAGIVHAHAQTASCKLERAGTAGDSGADDRDVDRTLRIRFYS